MRQLHVTFQAPGEAEAQCAAMVKAGKIYATGTEDMDALTFGTSVLLRNLTVAEARYVFPFVSCVLIYLLLA